MKIVSKIATVILFIFCLIMTIVLGALSAIMVLVTVPLFLLIALAKERSILKELKELYDFWKEMSYSVMEALYDEDF
jgi:hypothetical protein